MGVENTISGDGTAGKSTKSSIEGIYRPPPARFSQTTNTVSNEIRSDEKEYSKTTVPTRMKERRPDRAVYVPRARRNNSTNSSGEESHGRVDAKNKLNEFNCVPNSCLESQQVNGDNNASEISGNILNNLSDELNQKQSSDNTASKNSILNGDQQQNTVNKMNKSDKVNVINNTADIISPIRQKLDTDSEEKELERASKEMNRPTRRIIKQTFNSDVLEIPEVVKPKEIQIKETNVTTNNESSNTGDGDDWDSIFDDNGDCLKPNLIEELTASVGKVSIEKPSTDYSVYLSKQALLSTEEYPHVLEISNFPVEFQTQDLMMLFSAYRESGFDIKWVDDTHALVVFSNAKIAADVLANGHPFVVLRPLAQATVESRAKAKKCSGSLQPYKQRPETCPALARRLVSGALGVKMQASPQQLAKERQVLRDAKERKKAAKVKDDIWES